MRNMCLGITAVVVTVGMVSVGAQGRNFSGTWVIDSEKTNAALAASMTETRAVAARSSGGGGGAAAAGTITAAGSGGGGARSRGTGEAVAAGGGVAVGEMRAVSGGGGGRGGGGAGGVMISSDTILTIDGTTFTTDIGGVRTSYPLNGTEVTVPVRSRSRAGDGTVATIDAKARASWKGDMLVIETTIPGPEGSVTSTTSWYLEGDSLVRATTRMAYYKRK